MLYYVESFNLELEKMEWIYCVKDVSLYLKLIGQISVWDL